MDSVTSASGRRVSNLQFGSRATLSYYYKRLTRSAISSLWHTLVVNGRVTCSAKAMMNNVIENLLNA